MDLARNHLRVIATAFALFGSSQAFAAEGGTWSVSKSSGEVWIGSGDVQQASLTPDDHLKPGDTIRTGRNGRVLLVRGEESILIAPNSVVGLPSEQKEELSTTIVQRAGSILLEVEKRNVKHFEVETPYLAAVVKGTQFRVSVNAASTSVDVVRGQVEVTDFKSGQIAQVMPGQKATAFEHGKSGLSLSGSGTLNPIEQGKPRPSSVDRILVPKGGFSVRNAANGQAVDAQHGGLRIAAALGEVTLDVDKATHGLAHGTNDVSAANRNVASNSTVWSSSTTSTNSGVSDASAANNASSNASPVAATVAATTNAGSGNAFGIGNGNAFGIGNGNAFGVGNGSAFGIGMGNGRGIGRH
jgi:FecR protein